MTSYANKVDLNFTRQNAADFWLFLVWLTDDDFRDFCGYVAKNSQAEYFNDLFSEFVDNIEDSIDTDCIFNIFRNRKREYIKPTLLSREEFTAYAMLIWKIDRIYCERHYGYP